MLSNIIGSIENFTEKCTKLFTFCVQKRLNQMANGFGAISSGVARNS